LSSLHHFFPKRLAAMAAFPRQPQSIAIIGGGVAGLQALRALENLPQLEKIVS
jgi:predicted NAD/FAD-binding protein